MTCSVHLMYIFRGRKYKYFSQGFFFSLYFGLTDHTKITQVDAIQKVRSSCLENKKTGIESKIEKLRAKFYQSPSLVTFRFEFELPHTYNEIFFSLLHTIRNEFWNSESNSHFLYWNFDQTMYICGWKIRKLTFAN